MPPARSLRALIIGAGFGGIAAAIELRRAGVEHITLVDRAQGIGGTWLANVYPGAACDIPCHLYSLSYAPRWGWTRRYASQPELLAYLESVVDDYALRPLLRLGVEVVESYFDPSGTWTVRAADGEVFVAEVLIAATGQLSRPLIPEVPGLAGFRGEVLHSARWPAGYDAAGKRVAVVGTGASAIQIVPELAAQAEHLTVFQRNPPWILPKNDYVIAEAARGLFRSVPGARWLHRAWIWSVLEMGHAAFGSVGWINAGVKRWCMRHMARQVPDPELRARLTPDYVVGCKRGLISDTWYPALQLPNVALVSSALQSVDADALVAADGSRHPVDTIVFATGFSTTDFLGPIRVTGRDGRTLSEAWAEGAEAWLGMAVPGFPNFFLLYGPNTNLGHSSVVFMIECQARYIRRCVEALRTRAWIDVRAEVNAAYQRRVAAELKPTVWESGCGNWYHDRGRNTNSWPGSTTAYWWRTRRFDLAQFEEGPIDPGGP